MLLDGIANVLPDNNPIGGDSGSVGLFRGGTDVVLIELPPKIENARGTRRERRLREEEIGLYFFSHWAQEK